MTAHEGVIDKYLGEGLMALFGVPNAIEDAPRQAVNAAIAMRHACDRYAAEHARGHDLAIKIGILLTEERDLEQALAATLRYRKQVEEAPLQVLAIGTQAKVEVLRGDLDGAESNLRAAEEIIARTPTLPPWHLSAAATAGLLYAVQRLRHAGAADRRACTQQLRRATRTAAKVAVQRTEIGRLAALAHWQLGDYSRARSSWRHTMDIGTRLGAQPELARLALDLAECGVDPEAVAPGRGASGSGRQ